MSLRLFRTYVLMALFMMIRSGTTTDVDDFVYLQNSAIKVGIDTSKGGVIGYLSAANNNVNLINAHDHGRLVQLSFYGGPNGYDGCKYNNQEWPWNPIGSGDINGHSSTILNLTHTPTWAYVLSRPLQWACDNVPCDCHFEKTISLRGNAVWVRATISNNRADKTNYGLYDQELPATYANGMFCDLYSYTGSTPWTNAPLTKFQSPSGPPWHPGKFTASENWAAFVDQENQFGMGVYNANQTTFLGGYAGNNGQCSGSTYDDATGYIAPVGQLDLAWDETYTYEFALVVGYLKDIRTWVYQHHNY